MRRHIRWLPLVVGALLAAAGAAPREDGGSDDGRAADEQQRPDAVRRPRGHPELHATAGAGAGTLPISSGAASLCLLLPRLQQLLVVVLPRFSGGAKNAFHAKGRRRIKGARGLDGERSFPSSTLITPPSGGELVRRPVGLLVRVFLRGEGRGQNRGGGVEVLGWVGEAPVGSHGHSSMDCRVAASTHDSRIINEEKKEIMRVLLNASCVE